MYLELAKRYLEKSRLTSGSTRNYFANLCQVCLAKAGSTPADIGTWPQELAFLSLKPTNHLRMGKSKRFGQSNRQEMCKKYLQQCRQAQGTARKYYADLCLMTLGRLSLKPEDIGSSEEELQELQKKGFLESAANCLMQARATMGTKRKCYADLCWEYLGKAKVPPTFIGSSEIELQEMMK